MPGPFFAEMCLDRIAASKNYLGRAYTAAEPLAYLERAGENARMHPLTQKKLRFVLTMLRVKGEGETFRFLREVVLAGIPFEFWQDGANR